MNKYVTDDLVASINSFAELVKEWNRFSLVANSTLDDLWGWHFNDAFSIVGLLELNKELIFYDFGAGGGVIGFPLSLCGFNICLVERSYNKLFFLSNVLKYKNVKKEIKEYSNALVIVRGVSHLLKLLDTLKNVNKLILFKSFSVKEEINDSLKFWSFKFELFRRMGRAEGYIVYIYDLFKR